MDIKFLNEALFNGMSSNAFKIGTVLSMGWFWMRTGGCHNIYRGQDGVMDYANIQASMNINAEQVSIAGQILPASTIWHYIRRQASHCGLESEDSPPCIIRIKSDGEMIGNTPHAPLLLRAESAAGGKVTLRWRYTRIDEEIAPTGFNIYVDSGSGFDFDSPLDSVDYGAGGNGEFNWTSEDLTNGQRYRFVVRSYRTSQGESQNTDSVSIVADSLGPDPATDLLAEWEVV